MRKYKLHPNQTVYTSELLAIKKALQWILDNNLDFKMAILTDSLSAIQSIQSGKSRTRQDVLDHILYLIHCIVNRGKTLDIDRVPSHCNIIENELADAAAKSALTTGKKTWSIFVPRNISHYKGKNKAGMGQGIEKPPRPQTRNKSIPTHHTNAI